MDIVIKDDKFGGTVKFSRYVDGGQIAMFIMGEIEPICKVTINIPDTPPADGCIWVKPWSENEFVQFALEENRIAHRTGRTYAFAMPGWRPEALEMQLSTAALAVLEESERLGTVGQVTVEEAQKGVIS